MTDENTGNESQKPEMSLDELANSLVQEQASQPQPETPKIELPDPNADPDAFKAAVERHSTQLAEQVAKANEFVKAQEQTQAREKLNGDLNAAVDLVAAELDGVDKKLVRAVLKDEADENPAFKKIWDLRGQNPAALQTALKHLAKQYGDTLSLKVDPQAQANQRAFQQSVESARNNNLSHIQQQNQDLDSMSEAEFDQYWNKTSQGMM